MIAIRVLASTLVFLPIAVTAAAQTTTPPTTTSGTTSTTSAADTSTPAGSYDRLSIGNRKIARALFEAQTEETTTQATGTSGATGTGSPLTLDEISAMKQPGQSWGQVFRQLKEQGLVSQKNLGQVVSQYNNKHQPASRSETTTAANRTADDGTTPSGGSDKGDRGAGVSNSGGQGTKPTGASYTGGGRSPGAGGAAIQSGGHGNAKSK